MLIYLDLCCLKRPFDDQSQQRVRLETEATLQLLALEPGRVRFLRSPALLLENSFNPVGERAVRVEAWLRAGPLWTPASAEVEARGTELLSLGLKDFDALHLATAEQAGVDRFVTLDDRLITRAARRTGPIATIACSVFDCAKELIS